MKQCVMIMLMFQCRARRFRRDSRAVIRHSRVAMWCSLRGVSMTTYRDRLSTKAAAKLAKVLAPNAVPTIGQVVSAIMAVSEFATVCDCFWKCGLKNFFR